ncbi:MAG: hypothetical protein JNL21_38960 [Myxococcales bacterium]|nr:hypothetical protein [Myxococcales bacterium]
MKGSCAPWALCVLIFSTVGCKGLETGAKEHFGEKFSCPEDRVEVRARPDLKWSKVVFGDRPQEGPPDEVKKDPGRLAKWHEDHKDDNAIMACYHPGDSEGHMETNRVACTDAPEKPAAKK